MNLQPFSRAFKITATESTPKEGLETHPEVEGLLRTLGGTSYNHGLYRIITPAQFLFARETFERMHPIYTGTLAPFGYDWLGRHFAVDVASTSAGRPRILMLEPGSGDVFVIPGTIASFHNKELPESHEAALASSAWQEWQEMHPQPLAHSECVGFKKPLFLGGEDDFPNFERGELDVYIEFCAQVWLRTRDLPEGTRIGDIRWK